MIFRIFFHVLKTQLQKCFIKLFFLKNHFLDLSLKKNSKNYTPHVKISPFFSCNNSAFGAALIPSTIHAHQIVCFHCLWFIPRLLSHALPKSLQTLFFTRSDLCILWLHTANFLIFLSSLLNSPEGFSGPFVGLDPHHSAIYRNKGGSWRISYLVKTTNFYLRS